MKQVRWMVMAGIALLINTIFFVVVPLLDSLWNERPAREPRRVELVQESQVVHRQPPKQEQKKVVRNLIQQMKTFRATARNSFQTQGFQMDLSLAEGGWGDGVAVAQGTDMSAMVYDPNEVDQEARILKEVPPEYPRRAYRDGVKGYVKVFLVINARGLVTETQVMQVDPPGYGFEEAALKAIRQFRFEPARLRTVPVAQKATKEFEFDLSY